MSSLKMTFSLTSLILLIALGLVFVPAAVMAHDVATQHPNADGTAGTGAGPATHTHDGMNPVEAVEDDDATSDVDETVPKHNSHPTVEITLKPGDNVSADGTTVVVTADDAETSDVTENQFTLIIDFNQDVVDTAAEADTTSTSLPISATGTELTYDVENAVNTLIAGSVAITSIAVERDDDDASMYEAVVTVADAALPTGSGDTATMNFRIFVPANTAYSLQTPGKSPKPTVEPTPYVGGGNAESKVYEFTLVNMFPTPAPAAPMNLAAKPGDTEVVLSWNDPMDATITMYQYRRSADGGTAWTDWEDITGSGADSTSATIVGLMNDTAYMFEVRAVGPGGNGAASSISATPMAPTVPPGPVTNLMATAGDGQVTLTWTTPTTGGAVGDYEYSNNSGVSWMEIDELAITSNVPDDGILSTIVMNLTNGQTYSFMVRAINAGGPGGASNVISATPMAPTPPAAPASIDAEAGDGEVTLTWAAVEGADYYQYNTDPTAGWSAIATDDITTNDDDTLSTTVTGLTNDTEVSFMVRGVIRIDGGSNIYGDPSVVASATPMMPEEMDPASDVSLTVPAKSYVIVAKTSSPVGLPAAAIPDNLTEGSSATTVEAWSTMPNLEDLFFQGGSLLLVTDKATKLDRDDDAETDAEEAKERDVLITEIMAARNTAMVGQAGFLTHQWIELYNNLPVDVDVTLSQKAGTPAPAAADTEVKLDLVSNVVTNARWEFTGLGADGSVDDVEDTVDKSFVSFYRKDRGKDGHTKAHWATSTEIYLTGNAGTHVGTPGAKERTVSAPVAATTVPYSGIIINEVGNLKGTEHDWIELLNVTDGDVNVKNWHIGSIAAKGDDKILVKFPDDNHYTIPANGMILVVATDPHDDEDHPILAGTKWNKGQAHLGTPAASSTYYVAGGHADDTFDDDGLGDGDYNLVIRSGYDKAKPDNKIIDLTGAKKISDVAFDTNIWPLKGAAAPNGDTFEGDDVAEKFEEGQVFNRKVTTAGYAEHNWARAGFTGLGYKRSHEGGSKGSPGYTPDLKEKSSDLTDASVSISEIMYETTANKSAPQWIELYNNSATQSVNLNEWKLKLENADDADIRSPVTTNNLPGKILLPKQTVLIVSRKTASVSSESDGDDDFPDTRVINLYDQKDKLEVATQSYKLLSTEAFRITLMEKGGAEVDVAGNMG